MWFKVKLTSHGELGAFFTCESSSHVMARTRRLFMKFGFTRSLGRSETVLWSSSLHPRIVTIVSTGARLMLLLLQALKITPLPGSKFGSWDEVRLFVIVISGAWLELTMMLEVKILQFGTHPIHIERQM